jgi:hypothetical protein
VVFAGVTVLVNVIVVSVALGGGSSGAPDMPAAAAAGAAASSVQQRRYTPPAGGWSAAPLVTEKVVMLSRHGIRTPYAPGDGFPLEGFSTDQRDWPALDPPDDRWGAIGNVTAALTAHGAKVLSAHGAYLRAETWVGALGGTTGPAACAQVTASHHHLITSSPHQRITPSPHHPITPSPHARRSPSTPTRTRTPTATARRRASSCR